ncbi:unconventional myosin-XVIIIa-like [Lytechinus pictus]|uniref:unconventional myosin-XVIIIa-like n=1 Tax=Lytechinus pictus TaxID=7653 RepID=UPI0030B9E593
MISSGTSLKVRLGLDGSGATYATNSRAAKVHARRQAKRLSLTNANVRNIRAKSDDQLAQEKAWLDAERVWLVHRGGFSAAKRLAQTPNGISGEDTNQLGEGKVKVKLEQGEDVLEVEEEDVEKANPPQFDRAEDLAALQFLNESSVLHTLRQRYGANLIHSYAGRNLIIINPTHQLSVYSDKHAKAVIQMFRGCKLEDMPPHIYAAAQTAYRSMQSTRQDQSIVFMGRSGGGKSWNVRHVLQYLTIVSGSHNNIVTVDKITAVTTLLDAFGGARTIQNTSATRCANIYSLDFDHLGQIASSSIQILMLEKYRIVRKPEDERAFNIFYYLISGADQSLSQDLSLHKMSKENPYIQPLQMNEEIDHAKLMWQKVITSCQLLNFTPDECKGLWCVLAAIIYLAAAGATKGSGSAKAQFLNPSEAQRAATLLGVSLEDLARNTFNPKATGTPTRSHLRAVPSDGGSEGGSSGGATEALEGMISGLYTELVNAVVSLVNRGLSSAYRTKSSILVVDLPGLQIPEGCGRKTGASFQDLCTNYAQERLQLLFHDTAVTQQKDKYAQENIECDLGRENESESSPGLMVNLIDKQQGLIRTSNPDLRNTEQKGILWLLDEESIFPGASDDSFLERLYLHYQEEANRSDGVIKHSSNKRSFILNHIHGTVPITYNATNWLRQSREHPSIRSASVLLQESQKPNISRVFTSLSGSLPSSMVGSVAGIEGSSSLRRASSIRRAWTSGTAAIKRKSLCLQAKYQVDGIIESIRRTRLHFVHCLLPHPDAGLCEARIIAGKPPNSPSNNDLLNVPLLRSQFRGSTIMAAIRIFRFGFPESMLFQEFRYRFEILASSEAKMPEPIMDERKAVELLLNHLDLDQSSLRLGLSQIKSAIFFSRCMPEMHIQDIVYEF